MIRKRRWYIRRRHYRLYISRSKSTVYVSFYRLILMLKIFKCISSSISFAGFTFILRLIIVLVFNISSVESWLLTNLILSNYLRKATSHLFIISNPTLYFYKNPYFFFTDPNFIRFHF